MIRILMISIQVIGVFVAVDFISGVVHWLEDAYGRKHWALIGKWVIEPNIRHHFEPRYFTKSSFLKRNAATLVISWSTFVVVCLLGWFHWTWILAAMLGGVTNEIHCWTHRSPRENGKLITFLQKAHLIQSPRGHAVHHTDPKDCSYCTVTDWLNPLLDRMNFFGKIEGVVLQVTGLKRRIDESVRVSRQRTQLGSSCGGRCQECQCIKNGSSKEEG